jgi:hypothetical protein
MQFVDLDKEDDYLKYVQMTQQVAFSFSYAQESSASLSQKPRDAKTLENFLLSKETQPNSF